jgi:hypothetical protein
MHIQAWAAEERYAKHRGYQQWKRNNMMKQTQHFLALRNCVVNVLVKTVYKPIEFQDI